MYKNESFYVQTLKRVKEELKRIEEEENILITFKKWALHPCSQGDWQIQYQTFPPSHPTVIQIVANLNQWNLILKESLGNFDMFRVLFWLRTIKALKTRTIKMESLKGQCHEIFYSCYLHDSHPFGFLIYTIKFTIW